MSYTQQAAHCDEDDCNGRIGNGDLTFCYNCYAKLHVALKKKSDRVERLEECRPTAGALWGANKEARELRSSLADENYRVSILNAEIADLKRLLREGQPITCAHASCGRIIAGPGDAYCRGCVRELGIRDRIALRGKAKEDAREGIVAVKVLQDELRQLRARYNDLLIEHTLLQEKQNGR